MSDLHFSYSSLRRWQACPHQYALARSGEPETAPEAVRQGSALHEALRAYAEHCWQRGRKADKEHAEALAIGYPEDVAFAVRTFARDMTWPWSGKQSGPCPVEQRMEAALPNGVAFVGVLDMVLQAENDNPFAAGDGLTQVFDWKKSRPVCWYDPEPPLQLQCYAWLWQQAHPEALDFELFYSAPGWSGNWAQRVWKADGPQDGTGRRLASLVDRIMADERCDPTPGEACASCMYVHACRLGGTQTLRALTEPTPQEQAAVAQWHRAQAAALEAQVRAHVDASGERVPLGEQWYGYALPVPSWEIIDIPAAARLFVEAADVLTQPKAKSQPVARLLKLDGDNAAKLVPLLLESDEWRERALQVVRQKDNGRPRWGLHKPGNGQGGETQ